MSVFPITPILHRAPPFAGSPVTLAVLFLVLAYVKAPVLFLEPRFWAEEGVVFYSSLRGHGLLRALSHVHLDSYQLAANLMVYFSTLLPVAHAPVATTYLALAFHTMVAAQIAMFTRAYCISTPVAVLLVFAWAFLPQTYEVWLSATNTQWVMGVSSLLIAVLPREWLERRVRTFALWLAICGLSGVPGVLVGPLLLLRAWHERSCRIAVLSGTVMICSAVQGAVLLAYGASSARTFAADPVILLLSTFVQTLLYPLFGVHRVWVLVEAIKWTPGLPAAVLSVSVMIFTAIAALAWRVNKLATIWIAAAWLGVSLVQTLGSLNPRGFVSIPFGVRYFLFGSVALTIMLALASKARDRTARYIAIGILSLAVAQNLHAWQAGKFRVFFEGPSWRDQIQACAPGAPCRVTVWPGGDNWTFQLVR